MSGASFEIEQPPPRVEPDDHPRTASLDRAPIG
jgi:hypothetical protein